MKIDITGRQIDVTPALREFTEEKLTKLERVLDGPVEAHVVLGISKHRHTAEIKILARNTVLSGAVETGDLYASIGEVADKLERQALKHKEKIHDHKHRRGPRDPDVAATIEANAGDGAAEEDSAEPPTRVVRGRRLRVSPMSAEDAVLELEGTKGHLLVFRDATSSRINVLHKREDGSYDLLDLEP
jgi:putative sigma-54 modulation protein